VRVHKSSKGPLVDGLNGGGLSDEPKFHADLRSCAIVRCSALPSRLTASQRCFRRVFCDFAERTFDRLATATWGLACRIRTSINHPWWVRLVSSATDHDWPYGRKLTALPEVGRSGCRRRGEPFGTSLGLLPARFSRHEYWFFSRPPFERDLSVVGINGLLISSDYPYFETLEGRRFLEEAPLSQPSARSR